MYMMAPTKREETTGENWSCEETGCSKRMRTDLLNAVECSAHVVDPPEYTDNIRRANLQETNQYILGQDGFRKQCILDKAGYRSQIEMVKTTFSHFSAGKHAHGASATSSTGHAGSIKGRVITTLIPSPRSWAPFGVSEQNHRLRVVCASDCDLPAFPGCPNWAKPMMYSEYQVGDPTSLNVCICIISWAPWSWQAGFSEEWLCDIFSNLTEELNSSLQAAWLSIMIIQRERMLIAADSMHNRLRRVFAATHGVPHHQARALPPPYFSSIQLS
jgi:hypothetical protein